MQLTVNELSEILRLFPGHYKVNVEGCDCVGVAGYVKTEPDYYTGKHAAHLLRKSGDPETVVIMRAFEAEDIENE